MAVPVTLRIDHLPERPQAPLPAQPYKEWRDTDGTPLALFYRIDPGYLVRFPAVADFLLTPAGDVVGVQRVPGGDPLLAEHLLRNQIVPLALTRQHQLVLHAGAVEIAGHAVAFAGNSGSGKSTLTAGFAQAGFRFLTDDGLILREQGDGFLAVPGHAELRLSDDARRTLFPDTARELYEDRTNNKARFRASASLPHCAVERPLLLVYLLGDRSADEPVITPVSGSDAVMGLVGNSFLLDAGDATLMETLFRRFGALVRQGYCYRLDYRREFARLPEVRTAVLHHAETLIGRQNP